jgi:hypothetical protein
VYDESLDFFATPFFSFLAFYHTSSPPQKAKQIDCGESLCFEIGRRRAKNLVPGTSLDLKDIFSSFLARV